MNDAFSEVDDLLDETADLLALNRIDLSTTGRLLTVIIVSAVVLNIGMWTDTFLLGVLGFLAFLASLVPFVVVMLRIGHRQKLVRGKLKQIDAIQQRIGRATAAARN